MPAVRVLANTTWLPVGWSTRSASDLDIVADQFRACAQQRAALDDARAAFDTATTGGDPLAAREQLAFTSSKYGAWYKRLLPGYGAWKGASTAQVHPKSSEHADPVALSKLAQTIAADGRARGTTGAISTATRAAH